MLKPPQRPGAPRLMCATLLMGSILHGVPVLAQTESLPASVLVCRKETDALRRLACFDRETARFEFPVTSAEPSAPAADTAKQTERPASKVAAVVRARVVNVSVDHWPDGLVIRLDNGQTWEQAQAVVVEPKLHLGDTVTIEKRVLGTYWLNTSSGATMKVRQRKK